MNQDGVRNGYDLAQLKLVRQACHVPLIASSGAGEMVHFRDAFIDANVDGALATSVFHKQNINIGELKDYLAREGEMCIRDSAFAVQCCGVRAGRIGVFLFC